MTGDLVRSRREALGLSQTELAARAGVSRQLVGALESGRHLPRVDAALGLARALDVGVETLFGSPEHPVDVITGALPAEGALVRAGRVGDRVVTGTARSGWDADGVVAGGVLDRLQQTAPGPVIAGCEPAFETLEWLLREAGFGALSVTASSAAAIDALGGGRVHAAVVHGAVGLLPDATSGAIRFALARWQVGLAAGPDAAPDWFERAMSGFAPVIQRERGASVQSAFREAVGVDVPGPRVASHVDAVRLSLVTGLAAVTIEPAAIAGRARFRPLDVHQTELWVDSEWVADRQVGAALDVLSSRGFQRRLASVGGYDLAGFGIRAA